RVGASNSVGTAFGDDVMFAIPAALPIVTTLGANGVSTNAATLNGIVNPNGGPTTWYFQHGLTTNYGNTTAATLLQSARALQFNGLNQMGTAGNLNLSNRSFS